MKRDAAPGETPAAFRLVCLPSLAPQSSRPAPSSAAVSHAFQTGADRLRVSSPTARANTMIPVNRPIACPVRYWGCVARTLCTSLGSWQDMSKPETVIIRRERVSPDRAGHTSQTGKGRGYMSRPPMLIYTPLLCRRGALVPVRVLTHRVCRSEDREQAGAPSGSDSELTPAPSPMGRADGRGCCSDSPRVDWFRSGGYLGHVMRWRLISWSVDV